MADDRQPGKPATARVAAGPGEDAPADHKTSESAASRKRLYTTFRCWLRKHWRPVMFLAILLIAVGVGSFYKLHASPGTEPSAFRGQPPQYLGVYSTNPHVPITAKVVFVAPSEFRTQGLADAREAVEVTARPTGSDKPGLIIITSSTRPPAGGGKAVHDRVFDLKANPSDDRGLSSPEILSQKYAIVLKLLREHPQRNIWYGIAFFGRAPIFYEDNGSIFGHLPLVDPSSPNNHYTIAMLAEYSRKTDRLENVVTENLRHPPIIPAGDRIRTVDAFDSISITETAYVPELRDERLDYSFPQVTTNGILYSWHSGRHAPLEAVFKTTDPDAVDSQNQAAFTSGIAFGVAGAAAIAIVQELPKELPSMPTWVRRRKQRSKPPPQDA